MFSNSEDLSLSLMKAVFERSEFSDFFPTSKLFAQPSGIDYCPQFGYGMFRGTRWKKEILGHGGKEIGYNTLQVFVPEKKVSATFLCNAHHVDIIMLAFTLLDEAVRG